MSSIDPYYDTLTSLLKPGFAACGEDLMGEISMLVAEIQKADESDDFEESYACRMELVELAALNGKDEYAVEPLMWCLNAFDAFDDRLRPQPLLWRYKWVLNSMLASASVSHGIVKAMYRDLEQRLARAGFSARSVHRIRAGHAMNNGDFALAEQYIKQYQKSPRDEMSDCAACELTDEVKFLMSIGRIDEALAAAKPLVDGEMSCGSVPDAIYADLLWCYFDRGEYDKIRSEFSFWYDSISEDLDFIESISDLLLWLVIDHRYDLACAVIERHIDSVLGSVMDNGKYCFTRSCAALFLRMAPENKVRIVLPKSIAVHRDDDCYAASDLAAFFSDVALEIADRYDERNINTYYRDEFDKWTSLELGMKSHPPVEPAQPTGVVMTAPFRGIGFSPSVN